MKKVSHGSLPAKTQRGLGRSALSAATAALIVISGTFGIVGPAYAEVPEQESAQQGSMPVDPETRSTPGVTETPELAEVINTPETADGAEREEAPAAPGSTERPESGESPKPSQTSVDSEPLPTLAAPAPTLPFWVQVGESLTPSGVGLNDFTPAAEQVSYQWLRNGVAIAGATGLSYDVTPADLGVLISVEVTGVLAGFEPATTLSTQTSSIEAGDLVGADPTIVGDPRVGELLQVDAGAWAPKPTLRYQWLRDSNPILGATSSNYRLTAVDAGSRISVEVSAAASGYRDEIRYSAATPQIAQAVLKRETPTISGNAQMFSTIRAHAGTWTSGAELSYQWYRSGSAISGAKSVTYKIQPADAGKRISVQVTGVKVGHATATESSAQTSVVTQATLNAAVPKITGKPKVESQLKATAGSWTSGTTFSYQWYRGGKAISGAKSSSYTLQPADVGSRIVVKVTGTNAGYATATKTSAQTSAVEKGTLKSAVPKLNGNIKVGAKLKASTGSWTSGTKFSYQWYRSGKAISGAKTSSYTLKSADTGKLIVVKVTGQKSGYVTLTKASTQQTTWALKSSTPKVVGSLKMGSTVKAQLGTWTAGTKFKYQWYRNGTAISGANRASYKLAVADIGKRVSVKVAGSKTNYRTVSKASAKTGVIAKATLRVGSPRITGALSYDSALKVSTSGWTSGTKFTYQWYRNGKAISGTNSATYRIRANDFGNTLSVKVTGKKTGYHSASKTAQTHVPTTALTRSQENAISSAKSYLSFMGFSRKGLIGQLEYERYSTRDATFAVDYIAPNWNAQAVKVARSYLSFMSFSWWELYDQLIYEGFTPSQVEYALNVVY